ncbi:hypothetical protein HELRODRAFT_177970 [Helobdella robusta]|uniref:Apple domain-containing protein n=1 Tax=Helobdella robusta TaxID=6412 RepID=T1FCJ6_HELRO|nr:hypothetical protein HELRODRAFT_177970 [Helobdella robusta]ESN97539.1 hypothetical protein HELRODRAFT_177970 [Helobdella robusta]
MYFAALIGSCLCFLIIVAEKKCFQTFEEDKVGFCSCDRPIVNTSLHSFSFIEALVLCSMRCSQTASCVAYNFFNATNQCQLFTQTLNKFSVLPGCQYYYRKDGLQTNKLLTINVDNELREFYNNGENISIVGNFPYAVDYQQSDRYNLSGHLFVIAMKSYNNLFPGGLIASTADNFVLTNETWKCTKSYYVGWYKISYNDSLWPAAFLGSYHGNPSINAPFSSTAKWIIESTDCLNCSFYCRKNFKVHDKVDDGKTVEKIMIRNVSLRYKDEKA